MRERWIGIGLLAALALALSCPSLVRAQADDQPGALVFEPAGAAAATEHPEPTFVAVPEPTPLAVAYYWSGNRLWLANVLAALAVPWLFLITRTSAVLARATARFRWLARPLFAAVYYLAVAIVELPLAFYAGYLRPHAYGLSEQSPTSWFLDELTATAIQAALALPVVLVVYLLIRRLPHVWWLVAGALCIPLTLGLVFLKPVVIDPVFNQFEPMHDKQLEARILGLAHRAGVNVGEVLQVNMSRKTRTVNAYVTGFQGTHRIVLWDTLLERLEPDEIVAVMSHELGHFVLHHVFWGVMVTSGLIGLGLFLVDRGARWALKRSAGRWGFTRLDEIASLPLLILAGTLANLALTPVGFAYSRHIEHEADRFGIEMTHDNAAAARSFVALQRENLGYPRPNGFLHALRSTHPSLGERIDFCNSYRPWAVGAPSRYQSLIRPEPPGLSNLDARTP